MPTCKVVIWVTVVAQSSLSVLLWHQQGASSRKTAALQMFSPFLWKLRDVWKNPSRSALCETLRPARSTVLSILRLVWTSAGHVHSGNTSVQVCHCCPLMTDEPNEEFAKGVSSCEWTIGTVMLRHVLLFIWGLSSNILEPAEDQMILVSVLMRELPVCRSFSSSVCPTAFLGRTKTTTDIVFQKLAAVSIKDGFVWEKITGHHKTIWAETEGPLFCLPLLHFIIE